MLQLLLVLLIVFSPATSWAEETYHPHVGAHDPYINLRDRQGKKCCHGIHCRPALYKKRGNQHFMSTNHGKNWFEVPAIKEVTPSKEVRKLQTSTWCGTYYESGGRKTKCWVPVLPLF